MSLQGQATRISDSRGFAMAALLVALAAMAVLMTVVLPVWNQAAKREKEEELVFRGKQYARAIALFGRKYAGASPPNFDILVQQKFLRKKYKDPMVADGEFQPLFQLTALSPGQQAQRPGVVGRAGSGAPSGTGFGSSTGSGAGTGPGFTSGSSVTGSMGSAYNPAQTQQPGQPSTFGQSAFASGGSGGRGNIVGVTSKSTETSIRLYNGRNHYNEWQFLATQMTLRPGVPGGGRGTPGTPGGGTGMPGMPGGRGGQGGRGTFGPGGFGPGGMGRGGQFPGGTGRQGGF